MVTPTSTGGPASATRSLSMKTKSNPRPRPAARRRRSPAASRRRRPISSGSLGSGGGEAMANFGPVHLRGIYNTLWSVESSEDLRQFASTFTNLKRARAYRDNFRGKFTFNALQISMNMNCTNFEGGFELRAIPVRFGFITVNFTLHLCFKTIR